MKLAGNGDSKGHALVQAKQEIRERYGLVFDCSVSVFYYHESQQMLFIYAMLA